MVYDTYEYQESQTVIDKVNAYRMEQARATNKAIKAEAQAELDKTVNFATAKINEANQIIAENGLDFNQKGGSGTTTTTTTTTTTKETKPSGPTYDTGSLSDLEAQYRKLEDELKNTNVSPERLQ